MTATSVSQFTDAQVADAERAATTLETLVSRLGHDEAFAKALAEDPRATLGAHGLSLEKESMEMLMLVDAPRFDAACDKLFDLVDSDFMLAMVSPSCG